ncbi:hypothetical protein AAY473_002482 [Plecturocebus cupreus]
MLTAPEPRRRLGHFTSYRPHRDPCLFTLLPGTGECRRGLPEPRSTLSCSLAPKAPAVPRPSLLFFSSPGLRSVPPLGLGCS